MRPEKTATEMTVVARPIRSRLFEKLASAIAASADEKALATLLTVLCQSQTEGHFTDLEADELGEALEARRREILVPRESHLQAGMTKMVQRLADRRADDEGARPLICSRLLDSLERVLVRTAVPHGISGDELRRLINAASFMAGRQRPLIYLATVGDRLFDCIAPGEARTIIARVERFIGKLQKAEGLSPYRITVYESAGGLHAHLLFIANNRLVERLGQSNAFKPYLDIQSVYDLPRLVRGYLVKERTPQAQYALSHALKGGRHPGSHRLPGAGDRIRLSAALASDAFAAGYVEPWQRSNAKRSETRKDYRLRRIVPRKAARPVGQIPLFPELERPQVRLRDFRGGTLSTATALELEFHRRRQGLSQRQLGELAGISQPTIANAIAGVYGLSRKATRNVQRVLLGSLSSPRGAA